ncbi:hypothetical protein OIU83_22380 [Flavobacterium sp. LS1R49]|uniref:Phytanoyl-CoA dioxygenase n=1 Tax=Flavobacterium shii TaxID=2987687 RepID=A0A9X2YXY2_9FLAO|nr:hypothetical protein [Flavobacterium shii]MCV9930424.1 hypothetical protein [Flavobacterium shii]
MYKEELKKITQQIIDSEKITDEIFSVQLLSEFFDKNNQKVETLDKANESIVIGGIALSSFDAAICVNDSLRTSRFIKSVFKAINVLKSRFLNQKINILYAGCGPHATLLLPLLTLFKENDLDIILLDINSSSIESVQNWISIINLENFSVQAIQADAVKYVKPDSWDMHLLISETMFEALLREPQVAITKNLAPQLVSSGILIPEEINIDFGYTIFSKEPYLKSTSKLTIENFNYSRYPQFLNGGRLFTINKELSFISDVNFDHTIESDFYEIPKDFDLFPDVAIFTTIKIFDNFTLNVGESYITNPFCIASLFNIEMPGNIKLAYSFQKNPEWSYKLKGKEN